MRIVETNDYTSFADYFRKSVGLRFTILCKCCFFPYIAIFVQFDFSHLANPRLQRLVTTSKARVKISRDI